MWRTSVANLYVTEKSGDKQESEISVFIYLTVTYLGINYGSIAMQFRLNGGKSFDGKSFHITEFFGLTPPPGLKPGPIEDILQVVWFGQNIGQTNEAPLPRRTERWHVPSAAPRTIPASIRLERSSAFR